MKSPKEFRNFVVGAAAQGCMKSVSRPLAEKGMERGLFSCYGGSSRPLAEKGMERGLFSCYDGSPGSQETYRSIRTDARSRTKF